MTVREMVFRLWRRLDGGAITDDSKFTYLELRGYIRAGIVKGLKQSYFEQRNLEDFKYGDSGISVVEKQPTLTDPSTNLKYVNLLNDSISIAGNRFTQISSVNPIADFAKLYVPIRSEEVLLVKLQPCVPNTIYFYKEDGKAFFFGDQEVEDEVKIAYKYAIGNDDDADLKMPEEFGNDVLEQAFRLLIAPQLLSDRENNGVPNT